MHRVSQCAQPTHLYLLPTSNFLFALSSGVVWWWQFHWQWFFIWFWCGQKSPMCMFPPPLNKGIWFKDIQFKSKTLTVSKNSFNMWVKSMHMVIPTRKQNIYLHCLFMPRNTDPLWDLFRKINLIFFILFKIAGLKQGTDCASFSICPLLSIMDFTHTPFVQVIFLLLYICHTSMGSYLLLRRLIGCLYFQHFSGTLWALNEGTPDLVHWRLTVGPWCAAWQSCIRAANN